LELKVKEADVSSREEGAWSYFEPNILGMRKRLSLLHHMFRGSSAKRLSGL
jgi:hypothetical protein